VVASALSYPLRHHGTRVIKEYELVGRNSGIEVVIIVELDWRSRFTLKRGLTHTEGADEYRPEIICKEIIEGVKFADLGGHGTLSAI